MPFHSWVRSRLTPRSLNAQVVANVNGKPAVLYAWLKWALNDRLRDQLVLWSLKLRQKKD